MARRRGFVATMVHIQREAERSKVAHARRVAQVERDQRRMSDAAARARAATDREWARVYAASRTGVAAEQTREIESSVERLESVLAATLDVDDFLDLETLKPPLALPPFNDHAVRDSPPAPGIAEFLPAERSGMRRVFGSSARHDQQTEEARRRFEDARLAHQEDIRKHYAMVDALKRDHERECQRLTEEHRVVTERVSTLQQGLASGDLDAVIEYLDLVLARAVYPDDFPHSWRLAFSPERGLLSIDYELPTPSVVPTEKAYRYIKASDAITPVARAAAQRKQLYTSVVCQVALRVPHEVLEADRLGVVREIVFNGHVSGSDVATGHRVRRCVVGYRSTRPDFEALDLVHVEPFACLKHLKARLSKDPSSLVGVEPVVATTTMDLRFVADTEDADLSPSLRTPTHIVTPQPSPVPEPSRTTRRVEPTSPALTAGQNLVLIGPIVDIAVVGNAGLSDLSVLLLRLDGRVGGDDDFVFFNNPTGAAGAVMLRGGENPDGATIDLHAVPAECERIVLVASPSVGGQVIPPSTLQILDMGGSVEGVHFDVDGDNELTALLCVEIYRRSGAWKLRAVGQGYADGLAGLARDFGVAID